MISNFFQPVLCGRLLCQAAQPGPLTQQDMKANLPGGNSHLILPPFHPKLKKKNPWSAGLIIVPQRRHLLGNGITFLNYYCVLPISLTITSKSRTSLEGEPRKCVFVNVLYTSVPASHKQMA